MRPILFYMKWMNQTVPVPAYRFFGMLAALYLLMAVAWQWRRESRRQAVGLHGLVPLSIFTGFTTSQLMAVCFLSIAAFFAGARLLYALLYLPQVMAAPARLVELKLRNFSLHGGLTAVLLLWFHWSRRWGFSLPALTDSLVVHVGIAIAIMRLGCFFNGCCFGLPTQMPWGMHFPLANPNPVTRLVGFNAVTAGLLGAPAVMRHPTQLYEMGAALLASGAAWRCQRRHPAGSGFATALFGLLFSGGRLVVFFFRDFPTASSLSNLLRGPVVYGLCLLLFTGWLVKIRSGESWFSKLPPLAGAGYGARRPEGLHASGSPRKKPSSGLR
ncbi:prolipoprotein diacylglyceryl transferase family protein [Anoxynatronum buryatiense]|uniref:Prolipoprotein diacylglyceryl transferase n=1 Tax=Anoxynatronum buryatiense TaxID=489973 RepID=A0AA45WUY5_9CLOT|nr:prolipoprotein diacylglyceryl transferase family protein [Anoxynatronum buryatiense]SMP50935.1 Prolipoprotein diacylglyceryl transferase [Anoxynatronum buryatiense]